MPTEDRFYVGDDGTLDTVIVDGETGREYRYTFGGWDTDCESHGMGCESDMCAEDAYEGFLDWALRDASESAEEDAYA